MEVSDLLFYENYQLDSNDYIDYKDNYNSIKISKKQTVEPIPDKCEDYIQFIYFHCSINNEEPIDMTHIDIRKYVLGTMFRTILNTEFHSDIRHHMDIKDYAIYKNRTISIRISNICMLTCPCHHRVLICNLGERYSPGMKTMTRPMIEELLEEQGFTPSSHLRGL